MNLYESSLESVRSAPDVLATDDVTKKVQKPAVPTEPVAPTQSPNKSNTKNEPISGEWDIEQFVWPHVLLEFSTEHRWQGDQRVKVRLKRTLFDRDAVFAEHPRWPVPEAFADFGLAPVDSGLWSNVEPP